MSSFGCCSDYGSASNKLEWILVIIVIFGSVVFFVLSLEKQPQYKYIVMCGENAYRTNEIKENNSCVEFKSYEENIKICGNYIIRE